MDPPRQVFGKRLLLDECLVEQQLGSRRGQLHRLPLFYLLLQRPEVGLHAIDTYGQAVLQRELLGMLGQNRSIFPVKRQDLAARSWRRKHASVNDEYRKALADEPGLEGRRRNVGKPLR